MSVTAARPANVLRPGTPEEAGMSPDRVEKLRSRARSWVEEGVTQALVVLAARRGTVVLHEAFGKLTPEPDSPPLPLDALFPLASISKVVTATCAMMLVDDGLLGLNRPVQEYLPEFAGEWKDAVLVRDLMTHTTGWPGEDEEELLAYLESSEKSLQLPPLEPGQHPFLQQKFHMAVGMPLKSPPRQEMRYCGLGFSLLAEIIRRLSGQSLEDFAQERLFKPLGLRDMTYVVPERDAERVVKRPADAPDAEQSNSRWLQEAPSAAAGVFSTAMDMAVLGQMFLNRGRYNDVQVLSPATVTEMTRNQIPGIPAAFFTEHFPEASWGLGWSIRESKTSWLGGLISPRAFEHAGSGGVYTWVDPVYEIVGVYFSIQMAEAETMARELRYTRHDLFTDAVTACALDT